MTGHVQDLWWRTTVDADGKKSRVKSNRYGLGKRWQARWISDGRDRAKVFDSKDAARAHVAKQLVDPDKPRPKVTFGDYYETWAASQVHHRLNTARNVDVAYRHRISKMLGRLPLADVTRQDVQNAVIEWQTNHTANTVHITYGYVASVFKLAVEDGLIDKSPCRRISLPERPKERIVPLTPAQVKQIRDAMPERWKAAVTVAAATGMRLGELAGLTIDRIGDHKLTIDRQLITVKDKAPVFGPPKSGAGNRDIPIGDVAWRALQDHLKAFPPNEHGLVFVAPRGGPLVRSSASGLWRRATEAAGVPGKTGWHDLRHAHASMLIAAGLSPRAVADRLGHSDPSLTLRIYSHLWPDDQRRATRATDEGLRDL